MLRRRHWVLGGTFLCAGLPVSHGLTRGSRSYEEFVEFPAGSSELTHDEKRKLRAALGRFRASMCPIEILVIVGYAEAEEVAAIEAQVLSEERALNVAKYLQWLGLSPHVIHLMAYGTKPLRHPTSTGSNKLAVLEILGRPPQPGCDPREPHNGFWR